MQDLMEVARRIVEIRREKYKLAKRKRALEGELRELEPRLIEALGDMGLRNLSMEDATLYPSTPVWASSATSPGSLTTALIKAGLIEFVTYSPQRLTSWVRERLEEDGGDKLLDADERLRKVLPETVVPHVKIEERPSVSVRLNGAKEDSDE